MAPCTEVYGLNLLAAGAQCHDGEDDMTAHEQKYLRFKVQTNT
jgi:hypothetical protein